MTRHAARAAALLVALLLILTGCSRHHDDPAAQDGTVTGDVDTSKFDGLLRECEVLTPSEIATAVGGQAADQVFHGAICRWVVQGAGAIDVTLDWFEWGDFNLEKDTAKRLGYETENVQIKSSAAFTARDPKRPEMCGVTAKSPSRGILSWWVEPHGSPSGDPCAGPTKLMEMVMDAAY
ncbi:MAG: DUF3558 domain-containing protein [Gordonia sp. (in: high G+C Gram-positive bacteria)]|uniref:DUF3558 domain-containing protein n=1 Tax=Gordonia sp. (in: high G+C Gram-positive bacteria) TaxID=84139 RepID=UPI0039E267DB